MMTMIMAVLVMTVFYVACSLIEPHKLPVHVPPDKKGWFFKVDELDLVYVGMCFFIILTTGV